MPTNAVRAVLEAYAVTGVLGLARRDGNRRYYHPIERPLPADVIAPDVPLREQLRHKLLSRYRAHGLLGVGSGGDIFGGLDAAKPDPRWAESPGRNALRAELVELDELVPVDVEGVRGKRLVYVWELFLPPAKRRWGWYVLPIVFRDRFVGRIEPRIDRDHARVEVLGVWWEDGLAPQRADGFLDAMRDALGAYLPFAGASRLEWAPLLATEKRRFP
jgi:uncharacterized protein YcaQ